jgi:hypothetical protein
MLTRTILPAFALLAAPALAQNSPAPAPLPALKPDQQAALHCSALFARIAHERADPGIAARLPDLGTRGSEYFVRTAARLMDDTGATRPQVTALFGNALREIDRTLEASTDRAATLRGAMVPCRTLLDFEVPAAPAN